MTFSLSENEYGVFLSNPEIEDHVAIRASDTGIWDPHLLPYIDRHTEGAAIDLGANIGLLTVYMAKRYKKVYAFEPQPWVFWQLCANLALNYCHNVQPFNLAAYDKEVDLYISGEVPTLEDGAFDYRRFGGSSYSSWFFTPKVEGKAFCGRPMRAVLIDSIIPEDVPISFIKSDVQGCDLRALKGCDRIIRTRLPGIIFEWEHQSEILHGDTLDDYREYLGQYGYVVTHIGAGDYLAEVGGSGII